MPDSNNLADFLPYTVSQKSVSLVIADSLDAAIQELESNGYRALANPRDLETEGLRYVLVSKENAKEMYDLAAQYGAGQITMHDDVSHQNTWINPHYGNAALVFVVAKPDLESIEAPGLAVRMITGLAIQI